jgi:hypothetical protein
MSYPIVARYVFCNQCCEASHEDEWLEEDVYDGDEWVESYVECPSCGYRHDLYDPPCEERVCLDLL